MKIFLTEDGLYENFFPFSKTRSVADFRIGILTIREKWTMLRGNSALVDRQEEADITVPANIIPTKSNVNELLGGNFGNQFCINYSWEIFQQNDEALRQDFELITSIKKSAALQSGNSVQGAENIFVEEGAKVFNSVINATEGPVYIGKNVTIMEGCLIRGPFAICDHSVLKMGTKVYGATTIGPFSICGGEIKNSVFQGFSNKGHDGYLGDSVIGEWCNLGAGTNNSNLKNNAGMVQYQLDAALPPMNAGQKGGLLMGDYSRSAINTSFNTGTVVGVCCNLFNTPFNQRFFSDFTWGTEKYNFNKVEKDIRAWKQMKGMDLTTTELNILENLYNQT